MKGPCWTIGSCKGCPAINKAAPFDRRTTLGHRFRENCQVWPVVFWLKFFPLLLACRDKLKQSSFAPVPEVAESRFLGKIQIEIQRFGIWPAHGTIDTMAGAGNDFDFHVAVCDKTWDRLGADVTLPRF